MNEWRPTTLGQQINLKRGYDLPSKNRIEGTVPIYSSSGVSGFHNENMCTGPGVITGRYGTIGQVFFTKNPYWPLNTTLYVQDFKGNDELFIYYFLQQLDWDKYSDKSAVPGVNRNDVHQEEIAIPDVSEQKAIANVLSSLDDKIDLLHRQNKTLEAMAETLFRQWFIEDAESISTNQILIGDVLDTVSITHSFNSDQIIFLNTSDVYLGDVLNHDYEFVKNLPGQAKKSIKQDDILFSEIRPANGRYAYVDFDAEDYVVSTKLMVLRSKGILRQEFVYFYLINPKTVEWLQTLAEARSGTFPQITFDQLRELVINIPSDELLAEASKLCSNWLKKLKFNHIQIRTLEKLRDNLLPKLMSGEVRVSYAQGTVAS